jgi:hypothetical protein
MTWHWKNGIPQLATTRQVHGNLSLTAGQNKLSETVPWIEPTTSFRMLSMYITLSG